LDAVPWSLLATGAAGARNERYVDELNQMGRGGLLRFSDSLVVQEPATILHRTSASKSRAGNVRDARPQGGCGWRPGCL
jgi:hypothetical protein